MNKLAAARHKAEEKRATAEAKSNRQAAKTDKQAEYIRRTGRVPSSFTFCGWCWWNLKHITQMNKSSFSDFLVLTYHLLYPVPFVHKSQSLKIKMVFYYEEL